MNDQKIPATAAPSSLPVWEMLKAGHNMALYGLADGAATAYLHAHLQAHDTPHLALYTHKDLAEEQSPWLFPLTPGDIFSEWYLQKVRPKLGHSTGHPPVTQRTGRPSDALSHRAG